jgi:multidrug efflux system membrane fusion protein
MLGTGRLTTLTVPVSALRTDKPQPYVQVVENGKIAHKSVVPGARGDVAGAAMVAVSGLPEDAVVVTGAVGTLLEGTAVRFTAARPASNASSAPPGSAPLATTPTAPAVAAATSSPTTAP